MPKYRQPQEGGFRGGMQERQDNINFLNGVDGATREQDEMRLQQSRVMARNAPRRPTKNRMPRKQSRG